MIRFIFIISTFSSGFGQVTPNPERFKYDLFGNNLTINLFELGNNKNKGFKDEMSSLLSVTPFNIALTDMTIRRFEKVRRENKIIKQATVTAGLRAGTVQVLGY